MKFIEQVAEYIYAGFSGIWAVTAEPDDFETDLHESSNRDNTLVLQWDIDRGLTARAPRQTVQAGAHKGNPLGMLQAMPSLATLFGFVGESKRVVLVMHNLHLFMATNPAVLQAVHTQVRDGRGAGRFLVVTAPSVRIPAELEHDFVVVEHPLPDRERIRAIAAELVEANGYEMPADEDLAPVLDAAVGLTRLEADGAFARSLARHGALREETVWDLKVQAVKKSGVLSLHRGSEKFADVGGLDGMKRFARGLMGSGSAVDPELRGKGIMIVGVPGSGKSAFAKALGNEMGRPTLILDFAAMKSKFVGESVAGYEEVLIAGDDGRLRRTTFKDLHETGPEVYSTLACDDDSCYHVGGSTTIAHARRSERLLRVTTASGRSITVTPDHSLFTIDDEEHLAEIECGKLSVGGTIAVAGHLEFPEQSAFQLEIPEEDWKYWIADASDFSKEEMVALVGAKNVTHYSKSGVSVRRVVDGGFALGGEARPSKRHSSPSFDLDASYEVSRLDCRVLGYWLANGDVNSSSIRLHVNAQDADGVADSLASHWGVHVGAGDSATRAGGRVVYVSGGAIWFYRALYGPEFGAQDCYTKRVPPIVFQLPDHLRAEVLGTYLCSDGHFGYHGFEVVTASKGLAGDVVMLLSTFGIMAVVSPKDGSYRIRVQGRTQLSLMKNSLSFAGYGRKLEALRDVLYYRNADYKERDSNRAYLMWAGCPYAADTVVSIEEVIPEPDELVYDISVPVHQKFVTGFGGIWAHNSEHNIRKALKIADAMQPCVLFADEIEKALAGVNSQGNDSGVSEGMFGTFLTWLNDHTSDVFFVCSANDISKLPAEFTRAERFDRVFFVDVPGDAERAVIWEMYERKYGIDPAWTRPDDRNWTGAEIRACCRLAAIFRDANAEPLLEAARGLVPVALSAADVLAARRQVAHNTYTDANTGEVYRMPGADPDRPESRGRTTRKVGRVCGS